MIVSSRYQVVKRFEFNAHDNKRESSGKTFRGFTKLEVHVLALASRKWAGVGY